MLNDATCFEHIYIALGYTDLRSGIDRLVAIIKNDFDLDPYDKGSIFLFCGRRTDRIKAIVFEEDGIVLLYKRLADGKYQWPRTASEVHGAAFGWIEGAGSPRHLFCHRGARQTASRHH